MWAGRQAGSTDIADDLPLLDRAAGLDAFGEALHVAVEGLVTVAVGNDHSVAVTTTTACQFDTTIACSLDRRTARGRVVDTLVCANLVQDWMLAAIGEA